MYRAKLLAATAALTVLASASSASAATYLISRTIGTGSVNGTITTNAIGVLSNANITAFNLTLNDGTGSIVINQSNAAVAISGTAFTATATGLFFDFGASGNQYALFQNPSIGSGKNDFCLQTAGCFDFSGAGENVDVSSTFPGQVNRLRGNVQIGAVQSGAVPEPATWAMMIGGFGAIGGAMRYRRRKVAVSFA